MNTYQLKRTYHFEFKLDSLLEQKGVTQVELSQMTGIRPATISEMVHDVRSTYNKIHLVKVMDALNVIDLNDILQLHIQE